jgi:RNA polymerase sigma-70 factor (ECF subfamily)
MAESSGTTDPLLDRAAAGDQASWGALLTRHQERLHRLVAFRMDRRLQGRLSPSDVLQEAYLEAWKHLSAYLRQPTLPLFLWLRGITGNKLRELHRRHLGTEMRDAGREVALVPGAQPEATSEGLAAQLLGQVTRPSEAAMRAELKAQLQEVLNRMDALDREVLALRHFEQLTVAETAQVLGIKEKAAGKRYLRALQRLRDLLASLPDELGEWQP